MDGESGAAFLERAKAAAPAPEQAKAAAPLAQSSLNVIFDADFYRRQPGLALDGIAPLTHYLARGWKEGRDPCALFDTRFYLSQLPEAASSGLAPLLHYITVGVRREVSPSPLFDLEHYRRQAPDLGDANPLAHYVTRGAQAGLSPHPLFDPKFYLERAPHAREKARSALEHFIEFGASEKLSPHAMFDTAFYVDRYPDVARAGVNPLAHYLLHGRGEGRTVTRLAAPTNRTSKRSPVEGDVARNFPRLRHRKPANVDLAQLKALLCGEQFDASRIDSDITNYFYPSSGNRIVIYTAIFGKYDALKEPDYVDAEADYVCFTDQPDIVSNVFDVVQVSPIFADQRRCARALKTLPHVFLPGYEISLWVDGSTKIRGRSFREILEVGLQKDDIAVHAHFQRNCVYAEARECLAQKKDDADAIERQVRYLRDQAFPEASGLAETAQVLRRHTAKVAAFNEGWWSLIRDFSVRDQLGFNFVAWKQGLEFYTLPGCQWLDPHFKNYLHVTHDFGSLGQTKSVSLIMPVRNALDMTRKSVESILSRTNYPDYSLIIVDNDSDTATKDYLRDVAARHPNVRIITNQQNLSYSKANNDAVKTVDSEFILYINNDVEIIDPNWLRILMAEINSRKEIAAVGPILLYPDYTIQSAGIDIPMDGDTVRAPAIERKDYRHSRDVDGVTGGCMLVRRSVHEAIGGFDERFFYGQEDIDYCLKIRELGHKIRLVAHCEAIHHESHTRRYTSRTLRNREILRRKWRGRVQKVGTPPNANLKYGDLLKSKSLNYRSLDDLVKVVKDNACLLPDDIDIVVGIPRSGMVPAYIVGLMLNRPVISFDEFLSDIAPTKGDRPQHPLPERRINVLFMDDSINNGNAFKRFSSVKKEIYLGRPVQVQFMAVYASEYWTNDRVLTLARCELPRIFQWNYVNHGIAQWSCYDLDGVLCVDPTEEENDDGKLYTDFVLSARPLMIPKFRIKAIVTSRLEKYREPTEQWLRQHKVAYDKLYMLNLPSKAERIRLKAHGRFKAEIYSSLDDAYLFVESNASQAKEIAMASGKPVICTADDRLYRPN